MNFRIRILHIIGLTFLSLSFVFGQSVMKSTQFDLGFSPEFIDFSYDDQYMIAENVNRYSVWNTTTNSKVLEGRYKFKIGRFLNKVTIPTGSGYFLFGNEAVFMTVDYQHKKTEIKAFSLNDGSLIWESDQLDIGVSVAETVINAHATGAVGEGVHKTTTRDAASGANNLFTKDRFLDRLINYIPEKNAIIINGKNGLSLIDIRKGTILWTQENFKGGIGEVLYNAETDKLLAITIPATEGGLDLLTTTPEVVAVDGNSGKLMWTVEYSGDFIPNYATVVDNTLVLPYLQLTLIDLQTGKERDGHVKKGLSTAQNVSKGLRGLMALDKAVGGDFGNSKETSNKYNRLIPRQLHFNEDGKLCYFTMFNKKGVWGIGGKKGYMIIDIHQDKIDTQVHNVLGAQWTTLQDDMFEDIFYVKARGNLNRTIIKAIDVRTGETIFETDKAKNSADISKQFNPFMIDKNNNQLVDIVSKGIYVFNAKTGEELSYLSTKDLGIGTIKFSEFYPNGLLVFGTKGVGLIDTSGNITGTISTKNLKSFAATEDELWLLENKKFKRVDTQKGNILEATSFNKTDLISFSSSGKSLARCKGNIVDVIR
ncbi:PQQ-binding-like beta-propeller repeat protein [Winogradskyella sp. SM1960]|uniref:outer membrane protein assembly factor BamB family protein n=1 Tax=Winogradskyella sp. SM1960 TaxID=2865955 RepID=UPI001CD690B5|nr:PQQ-binding-like beta-propeller repeat protein [Winogradskyella sp. SM1960]